MPNRAQHPSTFVLWSVFIATLFLQFIGGLLYFVILQNTSWVQPVYGITKIVMVLAPMILVLLSFKLPKFTLKPHVISSLLWGIGTGLLISLFIYGIFLLFQPTLAQFTGNIQEKIVDFGLTQYYLLAAVGVSLIHSLFEEYFWRWYVVGGLMNRMSWFYAALLGAGLFALHHYVVLSQFFSLELTLLFGTAVGVGGFIWSYIYHKTGSLLGAWISHALVDGILFLIGAILLWG